MSKSKVGNREGRDHYFVTRPRTRLLEKLINGRVRDRDFLIFKIETRPGRDRESRAFSLESEAKKWRDLNKFSRFPIFCDKTRDETSWKINKQMSPRLRLFDNQNWSRTGTRQRVLVLLVSRPRQRVSSFTDSFVDTNWCKMLLLWAPSDLSNMMQCMSSSACVLLSML